MQLSSKFSPFWKRVSVVLTGTAIAQAIPLAILPVLTRKFPAEALGEYFIWLGIVAVMSVVATMRLDLAIFNAKSKDEVGSILRTAIVSACIFLGLCTAVLTALYVCQVEWLLKYFSVEKAIEGILLATLMAISQTIFSAYVYGVEFKRQAIVKIFIAAGVGLAQLIPALMGLGIEEIILGQLIVYCFAVPWLVHDAHKQLKLEKNQTYITVNFFKDLKTHWRFPVFSMPADFLNSFAGQLPLIIIGIRFGSAFSGQYALTMRALSAPLGLISGSIFSVFREEAARELRELGNCRKSYIKTFRSLVVLGVAPFFVAVFFSRAIFEWIFGSEWSDAGGYAAILAPMFYLKFISSPLSYTLYICNKQLQDLFWQICLLAMTAASFYMTQSVFNAIAFYSFGYSLLYIIYLWLSYSAARPKPTDGENVPFVA